MEATRNDSIPIASPDLTQLLSVSLPGQSGRVLYCTEVVLAEVARGEGQSLSTLAALLPSAKGTGRIRTETVWRWADRGIRTRSGQRIKVEAVRLAGRVISTRAALERFLRAQQGQPAEPAPVQPEPRPARRRKSRAADLATVEQELDALGI